MNRTKAGWVVVVAALGAAPLMGSAPPAETAPVVALLAGEPDATRTHVVLCRPGSNGAPATVGSFEHVRGAVTRGVVLPHSSVVLAVTDVAAMRERSWAGGLIRVEPGQPPRLLVDRVYHATRPLVSDATHVLVQRGVAGSEPTDTKRLRVDALSIDEIDADTGAVRTLHTWSGYETHLAGMLDREVIVSRVGPGGAELVAIDRDALSVRTIVGSWPAMARDFSVDTQTRELVVQQWTDTPQRQFTVERVDLANGTRKVVGTSRSADMLPQAWPGGATYLHPEGASAPRIVGAQVTIQTTDGSMLWMRAQSDDAAWFAALGLRARELPGAWAIRARDGQLLRIPVPHAMRAEVAGFVGGAL
jgi:hypothetical protein